MKNITLICSILLMSLVSCDTVSNWFGFDLEPMDFYTEYHVNIDTCGNDTIIIPDVEVECQGFYPIDNLEIPYTEPNIEYISHTGFSFLYNDEHKQSDWVAYMISRLTIESKSVKRVDGEKFQPDPAVKTGTAKDADYTKSGYSRGHLAPCEDLCYSFETYKESFLLSNVSPQTQSFNAGDWLRLETLVRKWAKEYDTLYVVTGPVLGKEITDVIDKRIKISVPKYFYKVILNYTSNDVKGIGFIMSHENTKKPLREMAITIDSVQKFTGIDFYYKLPDNFEKKIEGNLCIDCWSW